MLGGGAGRQLAHWAYYGKPEIDLYDCDIRLEKILLMVDKTEKGFVYKTFSA